MSRHGAGSVLGARHASRRAGGGSNPTPALPASLIDAGEVVVQPIVRRAASQLCRRQHYLGSYPGGASLDLGMFARGRLLGVAVLGAGPPNIYRLVRGAERRDIGCLARLWLDDSLGPNSESRTLGAILRLLRRWTQLKALIAYSDPAAGHSGAVYRAAGFLYLGESEATPLYRMPDGSTHHPRSLGHRFGSRSRRHFASCGVPVELIPRGPKLIYVGLVDRSWRERLTRPALPYPGKAHP